MFYACITSYREVYANFHLGENCEFTKRFVTFEHHTRRNFIITVNMFQFYLYQKDFQ